MKSAISSLLVCALLLLCAAAGFADDAGEKPAETLADRPADAPDPVHAVPSEAAPLVPGKAFQGAKDWVRCLVFHPESGVLFAGSADRCLRLWDVTRGELAEEVRIPRRLGAVP